MKKIQRGLIFIVLASIILLVGCNKRELEDNKEKNIDNIVNSNSSEEQDTEVNLEEMYKFYTKAAYKQTEDGWFHYFLIEFDKETDEPLAYTYDAYHLKYKRLSDYVIEIELDDQAPTVGYPSAPYYLLNNDYDKDFDELENFFETNKPLSRLTEEQIAEIDIKTLDKDMIIELFNTAIESEPLSDGKYYYMPEAAIWQEKLNGNYYWQIGYFCVHGEIASINIELMYEDGTYLTDIVSAGDGDQTQIAIDKMITVLEDKIMTNQNFTLPENSFEGVSDEVYGRLNTLMERMLTGGYDHTYNEVP